MIMINGIKEITIKKHIIHELLYVAQNSQVNNTNLILIYIIQQIEKL
ncbi:MAG: hypothetical protein CM15mV8_0370 [Caudoviricetes sp.]|nr:MAG: hypothetical protein CM15mV8_0370 [Caudoviricetes sp.]